MKRHTMSTFPTFTQLFSIINIFVRFSKICHANKKKLSKICVKRKFSIKFYMSVTALRTTIPPKYIIFGHSVYDATKMLNMVEQQRIIACLFIAKWSVHLCLYMNVCFW